eukprot:Seg1064.17 transcript_id=Seg1064.17/GoldUCD/mRNA.D3Y31 product="hypothetical protein" protein_id=Seg1064.17/GoldUCD/D3Y31
MEDRLKKKNQNRRNNIRITGIPEDKDVEQTWDDTEKVVKQSIKDKLSINEDFEIERCHRVNSRTRRSNNRSGHPEEPRPIVAKIFKVERKRDCFEEGQGNQARGCEILGGFVAHSKRGKIKYQCS